MIEKRYYELLRIIERIKDIDSGLWKLETSYNRKDLIMKLLWDTFYDGVEYGQIKERREVKQKECKHDFVLISSARMSERGYKEYFCEQCGLTKNEDSSD